MINIIFDLRDAGALRATLLLLSSDNTPLMEDIGQYLLLDVKRNFSKERSPYGESWAALSDVTIDRRVNPSNPILNDTGALAGSFRFVARNKSVEIGSNSVYAATQQFGAKRGQYGSMRNGSPIPWGDIPARKMLPIANNRLALTFKHKADIRHIVDNYIAQGIRGWF